MRLLHVHSGNLYGGVETLLKTLARHRTLCAEMQPEFALCFDGRIAAELREAGSTVHLLGPVRTRNPLQVIRVRRQLERILRTNAFDAVICHLLWPLAIFGPAVRRARVPLIFWMHDAVAGMNWLVLWARLSPPDLVICNSRYTGATLRRLYPGVAAETLYYPVIRGDAPGPSQRALLRELLDTDSNAVVLLQVSRMEPWKGHRLLLEALAHLAGEPRWVCWIAGGPQRAEEVAYAESLRTRAIALGLAPRIRFLGDRSDVGRLFAAADIYCQPNLGAEPFGIALIEAMQAGLPVVTTAGGGPLEIFDDSCGALVRAGDAAALAAQLKSLIRNEELRRTLGAAGASRAALLTDPGRQMHRLHEVIRQAAGGGLAPVPPMVHDSQLVRRSVQR